MDEQSDLRRCLLDAFARMQTDPSIDSFYTAFRVLQHEFSGADAEIGREINRARARVIERRERRLKAELARAKGAEDR